MRRFLPVLLLFLMPWPAPAPAGGRAPVSGGEDRYEAASAPALDGEARAAPGFELPVSRGQDRPDRSVVPDAHGAGALHAPVLRPVPSPRGADDLPPSDGSTPLAERLPYHATAPPLGG